MSDRGTPITRGNLAALRRYARPEPLERCDLCAEPIPADTALIVLPGSKATVADLAAMRAQGCDERLTAQSRPGRCGRACSWPRQPAAAGEERDRTQHLRAPHRRRRAEASAGPSTRARQKTTTSTSQGTKAIA